MFQVEQEEFIFLEGLKVYANLVIGYNTNFKLHICLRLHVVIMSLSNAATGPQKTSKKKNYNFCSLFENNKLTNDKLLLVLGFYGDEAYMNLVMSRNAMCHAVMEKMRT
jgi:hypothetical protein